MSEQEIRQELRFVFRTVNDHFADLTGGERPVFGRNNTVQEFKFHVSCPPITRWDDARDHWNKLKEPATGSETNEPDEIFCNGEPLSPISNLNGAVIDGLDVEKIEKHTDDCRYAAVTLSDGSLRLLKWHNYVDHRHDRSPGYYVHEFEAPHNLSTADVSALISGATSIGEIRVVRTNSWSFTLEVSVWYNNHKNDGAGQRFEVLEHHHYEDITRTRVGEVVPLTKFTPSS